MADPSVRSRTAFFLHKPPTSDSITHRSTQTQRIDLHIPVGPRPGSYRDLQGHRPRFEPWPMAVRVQTKRIPVGPRPGSYRDLQGHRPRFEPWPMAVRVQTLNPSIDWFSDLQSVASGINNTMVQQLNRNSQGGCSATDLESLVGRSAID
ncbi:hypothetical protein PGT21_025584 [Puccinia graminis f. sp. tritici]|uniref:Uncharacterized protein n=1 Tax=Puccinia graminis f. sp. tritici TaxID=56615 RepID=A0A5B0QX25_PUCGR|nr:hypothetical protein PGT21_025584 [Puccinia graminis f. sp. tritici]